jgi:hypothetical protein
MGLVRNRDNQRYLVTELGQGMDGFHRLQAVRRG